MILGGFLRFDSGTLCKLFPLSGLAWENPQWLGILDLSREPEISRFNFLGGFESAIYNFLTVITISSRFAENLLTNHLFLIRSEMLIVLSIEC
jgi:hypothetical protein